MEQLMMYEITIRDILIPFFVYGLLELIRFYRERSRPHVIMIHSSTRALQGREEPLSMISIHIENEGLNALFDLQVEVLDIRVQSDAQVSFQKKIANYGALKSGASKVINLANVRHDIEFSFMGHIVIRYRNSLNRVKYLQELKFKGSSKPNVEGSVSYIIAQHRDGGIFTLRAQLRHYLRKMKLYRDWEASWHASKTTLSWTDPI